MVNPHHDHFLKTKVKGQLESDVRHRGSFPSPLLRNVGRKRVRPRTRDEDDIVPVGHEMTRTPGDEFRGRRLYELVAKLLDDVAIHGNEKCGRFSNAIE
jgi:hypothetical protein